MIKYISVDDELLDQLAIETYAGKYPFLHHCGSFSNGEEGVVAITTLKPDIVFLDIEMAGLNGIDVLQALKEHAPVCIFITSHPEFALEAFELCAFDYILKPLTEERFAKTILRVEEYLQTKRKATAYKMLFEKDTLSFKEGHNQVRIPQEDIVYLEAMQDYTKIITRQKNYMALSPLSSFLTGLPQNRFIRVHRSYAVSLNKITELRHSEIICENATIPIGKTYRSAIAQLKL